MSWVGVPAGFIQGFVTGAALGVASNVIQGSLNELVMGVPFNIDSKSMLIQAGLSGIAGGIAGGFQARLNNKNFWTGGRKTPSVSANSAANTSTTPQELQSGSISQSQEQINPHSQNTTSETLIHYTNKEGYQQILETETLNPSIGAKNARYGEGQYLTNLKAKDYTAGQISRRLYGVPWNTRKVGYFLEIDVKGLNVIQNNPNNFLIPGKNSLNLHGRIINSGISVFKIKF